MIIVNFWSCPLYILEEFHGVKFMQPGAMHQARWMAKAVYAIKMDLFYTQFKMTAQETSGIHQFAMFVVPVYVRA